jgi:uncharacterized protein (DUF1810 family)
MKVTGPSPLGEEDATRGLRQFRLLLQSQSLIPDPGSPIPALLDAARFIAAQNLVYPQVLAELQAGEKHSHWMWFVFPQLLGLAHSERSVRYAIPSLADARHYLMHPVLGPRLVQCTELVLLHKGKTARDIFGYPDDLKFGSSMTLFARAASTSPGGTDDGAFTEIAAHACFRDALAAFYGGEEDEHTLALLSLSP